MADLGIFTITNAHNWFACIALPDGTEALEPLACWALVARPNGPEIEGMVVEDNRLVPVAAKWPTFRYVYPAGYVMDAEGWRRGV